MRRVSFLLSLALVSAVGFGAANDDTMAPYKGYAQINWILKQRVTGPTRFELGSYLGEPLPEPRRGTLIELMGQHQTSNDLDDTYRNAQPSPLSLVLWSIVLSRFSDDIGKVCGGGAPPFALRDPFREALTPLCGWPGRLATSRVALKAYWDALMGFDAPDDEFEAWAAFAQHEAQRGEPATRAVARITAAALLNPYFLLGN